jgi:hypothetical protein
MASAIGPNLFLFFKEKYVHIVVLILLVTLASTALSFKQGKTNAEEANVILQALTGIATLAILYFAYFYITSKKEEDVARLELAVRPTLVWDIESSESGGVSLVLKSLQHPVYNLHVALKVGGNSFDVEEKHMDIYDAKSNVEKKIDITEMVSKGLGKQKSAPIELTFTYHSEVGGKYVFVFSREVEKKPYGYFFKDQKIISATYPWKSAPTYFQD